MNHNGMTKSGMTVPGLRCNEFHLSVSPGNLWKLEADLVLRVATRWLQVVLEFVVYPGKEVLSIPDSKST